MNVAVVIRVYSRISDLDICLNLIKSYWKNNNYYIIVAANGKKNGFVISNESIKKIDKLIEIENNSGHLSGNSQLLSSSIEHIPLNCEYVIILEADTWVFSDNIIDKYICKMKVENCVWSSSEWVEKHYSLGLDFAIINTSYLKNNPKLFDFHKHPERYIYNYLFNDKQKFIYLKEAMPVHFPSLLRRFYNPSKGRMRCFSKVPMVTHHIEDLINGMEDKKKMSNITAGYKIFNIEHNIFFDRIKLKIIEFIIAFFPRSKWIKRKEIRKA